MSRTKSRGAVRTVLFGGIVLAGLLLVGSLIAGSLFDLGVPFSRETKDHSPPLILNEIRDLAEFRAAEAEFEVIVDRETDIRWVPSFVAGERVQFVAVGTVDATVDFAELTDDSVIFDEETNSATVIMPTPRINDPVIDLDDSGVMNRDRGVLDRVGSLFVDNPTAEIGLIQEAEDKIATAAASTDLLVRAEANTTATLTKLIQALGVENVRIVYEQTMSPVG
ncbi:MAG: DUF4230 domain-containing protein [Ilumatobacter sp.]|nr:DUF4230 domain-containing protein [Ilumatobacter sp.]